MLSEKIERQVEELHVKYGIKTVPVPIEKVADQLGIVVKRAPSVDFSGCSPFVGSASVIRIRCFVMFSPGNISIAF